MNIADTKISSRQFMFSIICFLQASAVLNANIANITFHESWLVVIFSFIIFIPIIFVYGAIIKRFEGLNLIQIIIKVFGPVFGRIISVLYLIFFLSVTMFNITDLIVMTKSTMLQNTPNVVLLVMSVLVLAWAVRSGLRVLTIYSKLFVITAFIITIGSIILLLNVAEMNNLFPLFNLPLKNYVQATHIINTIPLGEIVIFLMIAPNVEMKKKDVNKYLFLGVAFGTINLLITVLRDVLTLGETFNIFIYPSLVSFRLIRITEVLTRVEILFIIILIILLFFKISILYYISVLTVAQIFNLDKYKHIVLIIGLFLISAALAFTANPIHHGLVSQNGAPFLWIIFESIFPLLLLIIAVIFKLKSPAEEKL